MHLVRGSTNIQIHAQYMADLDGVCLANKSSGPSSLLSAFGNLTQSMATLLIGSHGSIGIDELSWYPR